MKGTEYECGWLFYDKEGKISHGDESVYILISRDFEKKIYNDYVWTTARMPVWRMSTGEWMGKWGGGQVVKLYDSDIDKLERVGSLPGMELIST